MCGITGFLGHSSHLDQLKNGLEKSLLTLKLRGPDSRATKIQNRCGLGHARLSIIDLSTAANQPLSDSSGRYTIVFNGEIFNYKELARELNLPDSVHSDTVVLLEAYIRWGEEVLNKLHGFFAFAIYDSAEDSLFLARDRYGMKPLFYSNISESFFFASELKALLCYPIKSELSKKGLSSFLHLSYMPSSESILESVNKLLPGHSLKIRNNQLEIKSYYKVSFASGNLNYSDGIDHLREAVDQAMELWVRSDVDVAAFLSGGVDSSIVVALASEKLSKLSTYSVSFPESPYHDESKYARMVAERYGTQHTEIPITVQELYSSVDSVLDYLDEPFADSSAIPTYALCQAVSRKHRVALSGDGADEVFGGYEKYRGLLMSEKYSHWGAFARMANPFLRAMPKGRDSSFLDKVRKIEKFSRGLAMSPDDRYWAWTSFNQPDSLLTPKYKISTWKEGIFETKLESFADMNLVFERDVNLVLAGDMLTKVDMMSMASSLEVRPVLLDHKIVDLAFDLPSNFKIQNNDKKKILIDAFKHLLPEEVYNRPKHGFSIELMPFFAGAFWEKINDIYLNDKLIKDQGIFNPSAIVELKKSIKSQSQGDLQALVWSLISFQNFYLKYQGNIL